MPNVINNLLEFFTLLQIHSTNFNFLLADSFHKLVTSVRGNFSCLSKFKLNPSTQPAEVMGLLNSQKLASRVVLFSRILTISGILVDSQNNFLIRVASPLYLNYYFRIIMVLLWMVLCCPAICLMFYSKFKTELKSPTYNDN